MTEAKKGRPIGCHCGTCRNCKRRAKYNQRKSLPAPDTTPGAVVGSEGKNLKADESAGGAKTEAKAKGAAEVITTSPSVKMPASSELPPESVDWDSLSQEDPDDPDPETAEAKQAEEEYEEQCAAPGFMHEAIGTAAMGLFMTCIAKVEDNGYVIPEMEFKGLKLDRDMLLGAGAEMVKGSATRCAVKYLPDMSKPMLYDELVVLTLLGGAGAAAAYTTKNPRRLKAPGEAEEPQEEETVGTGVSEGFQPSDDQGMASSGPTLLHVRG